MKLRLRTLVLPFIIAASCVGCVIPVPPQVGHIHVQKLVRGMTQQEVLEVNRQPDSKTTRINEQGDCIEEWSYLEIGISITERWDGKTPFVKSIVNTTILTFENEKLKNFKEIETVDPQIDEEIKACLEKKTGSL